MDPFHAGRLMAAGGLLVLLAVWAMTRDVISLEGAVTSGAILLAVMALLLGVDIRRRRRDDDDESS